MIAAAEIGTTLATDLPLRLDRLPWSRWHWKVVVALGITWILDGLEVTIVGAVASVLTEPGTLHLTETQVGFAATAYLVGAIIGALVFGHLTDRLGRKKLFLVTLAGYLGATLLTALSFNAASFIAMRALTGAGIGGEYAAINSAIDELLPARVRGRADLAINGSYWIGTALGAGSTLVLLNPHWIPHSLGWRLTFGLGAALGLGIVLIRRHLPESPRWLLLHGRVGEAEEIVRAIEREVSAEKGPLPEVTSRVRVRVRGTVGFRRIASVLLQKHVSRSVLGLTLIVSQAFCYNAIFFTYALVLTKFYGVENGRVGLYLLPFAIGNFGGPFILGRFFDSIGRRPLIASTYLISALLLFGTAFGFLHGWLTALTQTLLWSAVFFFASSAASSAYLTVSELFPVDLRGMAIALFYAVGTLVGGSFAPALFGKLISSGDRGQVFVGYVVGAALMAAAALVAAVLAVPAEGRMLEELAGEDEDEALSAGIDGAPSRR